jgi:hypothetical protein
MKHAKMHLLIWSFAVEKEVYTWTCHKADSKLCNIHSWYRVLSSLKNCHERAKITFDRQSIHENRNDIHLTKRLYTQMIVLTFNIFAFFLSSRQLGAQLWVVFRTAWRCACFSTEFDICVIKWLLWNEVCVE